MRSALIVVSAAALIALGLYRSLRSPTAAAPVASAKPRLPPGPNGPHPAPPHEPVMPVPSDEWRAKTAEKVRGLAHPGEAAFRALSDFYFDENADLAEAQAKKEGLTVPQVRELTYFGLEVLATQRTGDLEEILGRGLSDEERKALAELMVKANDGFKRDMRALVAEGASEEARWALIRKTEETYRTDFFAATGMNESLLDDLLAGNVLLPGAPANTPIPDEEAEPAPRDQISVPEKPR